MMMMYNSSLFALDETPGVVHFDLQKGKKAKRQKGKKKNRRY